MLKAANLARTAKNRLHRRTDLPAARVEHPAPGTEQLYQPAQGVEHPAPEMKLLYQLAQEVGQAVQDKVEDPTRNRDIGAPTAIRATTLRLHMIGATLTLGA